MIHLRMLGALDLRGPEGQELRSIVTQPKRIALLAYLALASPRGPQRRHTLLPLFWPEHDAVHARNSLNQSVHVLRQALGARVLVSRDETVGLDPQEISCDAIDFESLLLAGALSPAVELYRGDLMEGFHVSGASEFDGWLENERSRLAGQYAKALETLAEGREAARDPDDAVRYWKQLASRDRYNSRIALRLMRALTSAGDPAGAAQHAREHQALLREDLGIEPGPELVAFLTGLQSVPAGSAGASLPEPSVPNGAGNQLLVTSDSRPALPLQQDSAGRQRRTLSTTTIATGLLALGALGGTIAVVGNHGGEPARPVIRSLAVLPLQNLSQDSSQQAFTDGMHDLLITELARYPELSVISRTSVLRYRGTEKPLPEVARELKVDGIVEGTVIREGGRIRLTAQLVHGPTDRHVWAQRYDRDLRDVLLLQSELARAIAREVNVAVKPLAERHHHAPAGPPDSAPQELHLQELYLRARHAELNRSLTGVQNAMDAYRRAIDLDSTFALGYAGLADAYEYAAVYAYAPAGAALDTARILAERAVMLDSTNPEARTSLAVLLGDASDFAGSEREFRRAIQLSPSNARAHYMYSVLLVVLGRGEEALRESVRAAQLDPFAPRGVMAMQRYALFLMTGQRSYLKQLPVRERRPILKFEPGEPWARAREADEFAQEGNCIAAHSEIRRAQQQVQADNPVMLKNVALVHWLCGDRPWARKLLKQIKRRADARDHGFHIAWLHAQFGEKDSAFAWLNHQRWTLANLSSLSAGRWVDTLRSDPRFAQLLRRLGLRDS